MELLISLAILAFGYWLVNLLDKQSIKDMVKKRNYPSATVHRLDECEKKIS